MKSTKKTSGGMNFHALVENITTTHQHFQHQAIKAINRSLTLRNWIIGWYIVEFEQRGEQRAQYGSKLLSHLATKFKSMKGLDERSLRNFRTFFICYPHFIEIIQEEFKEISTRTNPKFLSNLLRMKRTTGIWGTVSTELTTDKVKLSTHHLIDNLSYSHFETL